MRNTRRVYVRVHGREPSCGELARETGIERAQVESLIAVERVPRSLDEPDTGDEGARGDTVGDRLVDAGAEEAYERAARRLALTSLLPRIASLSCREQTILRGRARPQASPAARRTAARARGPHGSSMSP